MAITVVGGSGKPAAPGAGIVTPEQVAIQEKSEPIKPADLGIEPEKIRKSMVTLSTSLFDDSESVRDSGCDKILCRSHNAYLQFLRDRPSSRAEILIGVMALSGRVLSPYHTLSEAPDFGEENFRANFGRTPLHQKTIKLCNLVTAKQQQLIEFGIPTRTVTTILTDGLDSDHYAYLQGAIEAIAALRSAYKSTVFGIGLGSMAESALLQMRIPREFVLPAGNEAQMMKAFETMSQATSAT